LQRYGIMPTIVTYSALITACEKGSDLPAALKVSADLQCQGGLKPNIVTFNALICACGKRHDVPKALQLYMDSQR